jgi:hypothetical protein
LKAKKLEVTFGNFTEKGYVKIDEKLYQWKKIKKLLLGWMRQ